MSEPARDPIVTELAQFAKVLRNEGFPGEVEYYRSPHTNEITLAHSASGFTKPYRADDIRTALRQFARDLWDNLTQAEREVRDGYQDPHIVLLR